MSEPPFPPPRDHLPLALRLDAFIEQLRADRRPQWPTHGAPSNLQLFAMATMFCAARPGANQPHPRFVASLRADLIREFWRHDP
jgi:hypothetical protein